MNQEQSNKSIEQLIEDLRSSDGMVRQRARQSLVLKGEEAVDDLIQAFKEKKEPIHFEASKALSQIGSKKTIQTFIDALEDEEFSIRWIAAEGLIAIREDIIKPLLELLEHHSDSLQICEGVHHVFHDIVSRRIIDEKKREILLPVLESYHHLEAEIYIPFAAKNALDKLKN